MIYFCVFCLSGFLFQIAKYEKKKFVKNILYFIAIIIPVVLAAVRGINVGKDTSGYAYPVFLYAKEYKRFIDFIGYDNLEPAFLLIEYIGAKYFNSFAFVLGTFQLIIDYCYFKIIKKYGENDLAINMMIFYFMLYGGTLNAIRQSVATALILLAATYFLDKNYIKFAVFFVIALTFHITAAITIIFFVIYAIADNDRVYKAINLIIIGFSFVLTLFWRRIFSTIFNYILIWGTNYSDYLIYGKAGERNETSIICGILALIIICCVNKKKKTRWTRMLISLTLIFLFFQPITEKIYVASRLLLYPQAFMLAIFPMSKKMIDCKIGSRDANWVIDLMLLIFFFAIWYYSVIINNSNSIMPYTVMNSFY